MSVRDFTVTLLLAACCIVSFTSSSSSYFIFFSVVFFFILIEMVRKKMMCDFVSFLNFFQRFLFILLYYHGIHLYWDKSTQPRHTHTHNQIAKSTDHCVSWIQFQWVANREAFYLHCFM